MVIFDMRGVCQQVVIRNPTNRNGCVDLETDDGRQKRVIVEAHQTVKIGIVTNRYIIATATPGIILEGK